jgi:hypothetical protein
MTEISAHVTGTSRTGWRDLRVAPTVAGRFALIRLVHRELHESPPNLWVGLKGAGGLVREPNETLESFALQNLDCPPTTVALD